LGLGWILAVVAAVAVACAWSPAAGAQAAQQPAAQQQPNGNPFPEDLNSVPLMPSSNEAVAETDAGDAGNPNAAPAVDSDPVKSPDDAASGDDGAVDGFSSSRAGIDSVLPGPDTEPAKKKKSDESIFDRMPKETAQKDIDVGNYYIERKDWRAAASRFQSALVLAPENPDVYWGLAESERHLGKFAEARANYEKVVDYDPDSRHGREAAKLLKDPQVANAEPKK
jgi:tetratricopeptide (TPR) repeat protein